MLEAEVNKTSFDFMILILIFVENCLQYDAIHDFFSEWLRTSSNPADINRFRAILENAIKFNFYNAKLGLK